MILSPRGEFSPGAVALKAYKKRPYLALMRQAEDASMVSGCTRRAISTTTSPSAPLARPRRGGAKRSRSGAITSTAEGQERTGAEDSLRAGIDRRRRRSGFRARCFVAHLLSVVFRHLWAGFG